MFLSNYLYWHVFLTHTAYYLYLLQVTSTLTFAAACASAGITVLIGNDLGICNQNHCLQFETSTAMAFLSWFTALPSFLLNFWSLASRWMTPQLGFHFICGTCVLTLFASFGMPPKLELGCVSMPCIYILGESGKRYSSTILGLWIDEYIGQIVIICSDSQISFVSNICKLRNLWTVIFCVSSWMCGP